MEAVIIVTIKEKIKLFKNEEEATKVELITFDEVGFSVVSQKDLYKIGDKAIFILPDYCVSDIAIFQDFIAPGGDISKSYLGKIEGQPRRIRAKKFNLHTGDGMPVYSNGILLPLSMVALHLEYYVNTLIEEYRLNPDFLTSILGITKYEQPEEPIKMRNGQCSFKTSPYPSGVYKTDETNINLLWKHMSKHMKYPIRLIGSEKIDGSSISIGITDEYPKGFILSRNVNVPLTITKITGRRKKTLLEYILFWKTPDLNIYQTVENDNVYVEAGKPYLEILSYAGLNDIILRGELNGGGCKGSGNSNNPSLYFPLNIKMFCIDEYINRIARKMKHAKFTEFCKDHGIQTVPIIFNKSFKCKKHLIKTCEDYFIKRKEITGKIIEGIVLTTPDCSFSAKYMNNEYDSKK